MRLRPGSAVAVLPKPRPIPPGRERRRRGIGGEPKPVALQARVRFAAELLTEKVAAIENRRATDLQLEPLHELDKLIDRYAPVLVVGCKECRGIVDKAELVRLRAEEVDLLRHRAGSEKMVKAEHHLRVSREELPRRALVVDKAGSFAQLVNDPSHAGLPRRSKAR